MVRKKSVLGNQFESFIAHVQCPIIAVMCLTRFEFVAQIYRDREIVWVSSNYHSFVRKSWFRTIDEKTSVKNYARSRVFSERSTLTALFRMYVGPFSLPSIANIWMFSYCNLRRSSRSYFLFLAFFFFFWNFESTN